MERLTERTKYGIVGNNNGVENFPLYSLYDETHLDHGLIEQCFNKLAEYEDLEEQGLLLRLPFKLPSVIWCAKKGEPTHKSFYDVPSQVISDMEYGYVFGFTKEEAEQALAKMKEV